MFESIVSTLINRFLGAYIENFDSKSLNIGIWSGDVRLKNLRLKKESLDKFRLPLDVKFGHLGELTLQIPWSNLKGKPVKVIIEDVYLLALPIILEDFDADEDHRRMQQIKQDKLKDLEALQSAINSNDNNLPSSPAGNESFTESLVTKIVDNLQVTIKNIHVRYEDDAVLTENPYSLGLTLSELSAASTDENWLPSFIAITQSFTRKLLVLRNFACYMTTESASIYDDDPALILLLLKACFTQPEESFQYLLKPVSGEGHLVMHKAGATDEHPHIRAELFFDEFGIDFDSHQYRDILWTALKFHWYQKTWKFRKLRPRLALEDAPKEWFKYAAVSVLNEIHEKNHKWSWDHFRTRRDQRKAYISLWKQKLMKRVLTPDQQTEFTALEEALSYEDIKFYRSLTRNEVRKENLVAPPAQTNLEEMPGGWFSSWWGGAQTSEPTTEAPEDEGGLDLTLTDEQRKALYETIDYNENQPSADLDAPRDRVTMEVLVNLKRGGISLKQDKESPALAEVIIEGCQTQFFQRPNSFLANFQLQEFKIEDGTTKPLYKHIVSVKHDHSQLHADSSKNKALEGKRDPFFQFSFEHNPLDGSADSSLLAKLKSMTIFYNHIFVAEIIKFFKPPNIHLDTVGAIMNAAEATMEGFTSQTRIGLQYALEEHKTLNVKLDLQAPLLILPLDPRSWKSPVAIIDAGHLSVTSDLVDKRTIEKFSSKQSYTEEDWGELNTLMYDKFNLHLQDAQFLVGPTIKDTMEQLHTKRSKNSALILDNFDFRLSVGISILSSATNLARFRVSGEVPNINLALSDFQYKTIMQLVDILIPNTEEEEDESSSVFNAFGTSSKLEEIEDADKTSKASSSAQQDSQHLVEIDFRVEKVVVAMFRCINGITLETEHLIDIIGDSLNFTFFKTEKNMHLDLSLTDINLVDHIETSGIKEFENLVSSNSFLEEEAVTRKNPELFKLEYDRVQRIVEHNGKEIEIFDQNIALDMSALKCVVSRKSLLSLLNFVLNTFTDANAESTPADELKHNDVTDDTVAPQKINVLVNLDSIIVVLNEDGIKLATLQLSTALIKVLVLPVELQVNGKLGALTLHDESNQGLPRNSVFRSLVSIEGDNLAEFSYKTFDPETHNEPYQSSIEFTTAATKVNFVEEAFVKIFSYLNKFQRMKAIYDSAREAAINQANQIDNAGKIKLNILVRAPIVHFPKFVEGHTDNHDVLIAELGELYLSNVFEVKSGVFHNIIEAGLRNININTHFNFMNDVIQNGKIVENLDVNFNVDYVEEDVDEIPNVVIVGRTHEINMKLTELQLRYMNNLQNSISRAFSVSDEGSLIDIEEDADQANAAMKYHSSGHRRSSIMAQQIAKAKTQTEIKQANPKKESVFFNFEIPKISLTLYNKTKCLLEFESKKLCSLAVNSFKLSFTMRKDSHFEADVSVSSFTISDVREGTENKFAEIISPIDGDRQQFFLNASTSGECDNKITTLMLTVDEPRTVLALDHIFELQAFAYKGFELDSPIVVRDYLKSENDQNSGFTLPDDGSTKTSNVSPKSANIGLSVNIINPSVILLADSTKVDTEALVFKVEQVLFTSQNIISLAVENVGMYVVRMDRFQDQRMRIIDDFSMSFALDSRGSTPTELLTSMQLSVDPLLLRISLHDIRLAMRIFEKANVFYTQAQTAVNKGKTNVDYSMSEDFKRKLAKHAPSSVSSIFGGAKKPSSDHPTPEVAVAGEEFESRIGGARLVLIGDVHELPVLDMGIKPFEVKIFNWSTELSAEAHFESYVNIYNYAKSTWEPLLESWQMAVYASKVLTPKPRMMIEVVSRDIAQLSISSRSVALLSQIAASITADVAPKTREKLAPYIVRNETGFDIEVWIDRDDELQLNKQVIPLDGKVPWEFEDWRTIRENLDTDSASDVLGVKLLDSKYDPIRRICASGEGEEVFSLYPPVNGIHNRLVSEITLGSDNVKTIRLRSTVTIRNSAEIPIAVKLVQRENDSDFELVIDLGQEKALPIDTVYSEKFKIRPHIETKFNWSNESLDWKSLMQDGRSLQCSMIGSGEESSYFFQAEAQYQKSEPLAKIYPHLTVVISAPLEIENLLPFDFNFRLYDKSSKKDWNGRVKKGKSSFIQVVTLESLLLLSVEPCGCGFGKSEFAIINSRRDTKFKRESSTSVKNESGQTVKLRMYYPKNQSSKTSLKVVIYSPYVILNRTGQNLQIGENSKHNPAVSMGSKGEENTPHIFSFENDDDRLNRALAKIGDSSWSDRLSFDAIGQVTGMAVQTPGKSTEKNFGVSIAEGEGKYNLTKVITFAPRYVMRNCLEEPVVIAENGSTKQFQLGPGELYPLYDLRRNLQKTMLLKFARDGNHWSSPFAIDDIGQIFLKAQKASTGQVLLKVNIITENATIYIQIENANNAWPFSIRNFTDADFYLYQGNPSINLNGEVVKKDVDYKPIYYKVPAKSVMPYSYDYPNAVVKEIIIRSHGRERSINLAEIGNLKPFRLPQTSEQEQIIVDLNVVADGPTQSLVITKYDPSLSLYKLQDGNNSNTNVGQLNFEVNEQDENYYTKIFTRFEGFGLSFINNRSQELCYLSLRGVELRYNESDLYQNLSMKLKWIQLDNQLYGGIFPIIIYPTLVPRSGKELNNHPSFSASVCKVKDESHGVLFIKYATVLLQEMSIEVDEDFLFALIDFAKFPGASWNIEIEDKLCDENLEIPEPKKLAEASDIYFEALHLQPALTNLSFVRTERVNAEDRSTSQNTLMFFVNMLTMAIGNINDAPIKLNALFIENIRVPIPILMESIRTHYGQSFFYQLHKILGSADFLGNPVGLFNNLSSGVLDIFYEPYQGFVINDRPQEIGIGIAKGGLSFLKKSVFGFSDSFAKVTGSLAKGLSVATMDRKFQERRRLNQRRNRPKHALYGFTSGANSFFDSISSGVTGIAQAPFEGATKEGAGGFFKGLGKGVIGLPTKTAIGIFDLASNVSEGIRNTTTVFDADGLEKIRLPRYISYDNVIRPYSAREAQGQFWLKTIDGGSLFDETYVAHLIMPGEEKAVLITFKKIVLFEMNSLKTSWIVAFSQVKSVSLETTGVSLILQNRRGPFLPVPEKKSRMFLYNKMKVAVDRYNKTCQVEL
ncbi:vacuolar protein sorting-associated protein 13 [Metschnikowia bicuspidata var. bicuspidata NRRL YB-4993]|uniref:Vacuolar protein sorting-associated protein n=1 Tax=Metschnikowia bicuspidata var. bicuspidata NRRL YB-4993 TaxID=869754 RepID=A0A1A0HD15_9ASCO|nr:vacuolar protein sorting-associated protein 13 [Metschnikowia bicuspidata var. bicuspidata NRRL YB-4993]OBA21906.1 vacuolar protein sorting-associated protein 13 [Metschnikowia bicuspidata var. bicuspidata NRRL YB-4993]